VINLLYGDFEGGQRVITQFALRPRASIGSQATRHFNVDRPDPRWAPTADPGARAQTTKQPAPPKDQCL